MRTIREYFDSFSGGWTNAKGGPLIVLLLCMLVTLGGWYYTQNSVHQAASGRFETNRLLVESQIKNRMAAYEQILRGGQGLFTAFPELSRDAWKQYVDALKLDQNFPGIQGVGFSQYIKPEALDQHVSQVRKEGFPEYRVKPEGERDAYTAILFLEPFDERNRQAFGYDMFSQETRRAAMESARDTGRAALSGRVELVQEITEDKQAGFLLYLPLYSTATKPATVELRREKLLGYVYSPFRATNLMRGILREESSIVSFRLYDGDTPSETSLLYDGDQELHLTQASQEPLYKTVSTIFIAGRPWTIVFRSTPLFESRLDFTLPMSLLVAGLIFSTMTFIISWMLVTTRNHATKLTEQAEQLSDVNKALEQSKLDAEQASRAKSAFLAAMSHEIRTPMNGVVGMVEILAHSELSSQQLDAVHTIRESSFSLLDLIDDVLDFSKIEAGRLELERVPVTVEEIVEGICTSLKSVAVSQGVSLSVFVSPDVPVQIWSDRTRLRQILYNLIGNAVKFSGGQSACVGRVDVQCTMSSGSPDTPAAEFIEFSVIDNGIGIAEETIQTLFTTFTQAETSTTRRFGGTGLGLAIAKRLVTLMGGEIWVKSELGVGSSFTVRLPVELVDGAEETEMPSLNGVCCMLTEGGCIRTDYLKAYLEHANAGVSVFSSLKNAASMAEGSVDPAIIVCDSGSRSLKELIEEVERVRDIAPACQLLVLTRSHSDSIQLELPNVTVLDGESLQKNVFVRAIAQIAGREIPDAYQSSHQKQPVASETAGQSAEDAERHSRVILVAEDDPINQKVILRQLDLLGYSAEVAKDGKEALQKWRSGRFSLLLSDLHMPLLDGYALAQAIRSEEGASYIPIIALTANAIRGEASRAEAAGMNGYLTKPVQLQQLKDAIEEGLDRGQPPESVGKQSPTQRSRIDLAAITSVIGDDPDAIREVIEDFLGAIEPIKRLIGEACSGRDAGAIVEASHRFKSNSRSVGAHRLGDICEELESVSERCEWDAVQSAIVKMNDEIVLVRKGLTSFIEENYLLGEK